MQGISVIGNTAGFGPVVRGSSPLFPANSFFEGYTMSIVNNLIELFIQDHNYIIYDNGTIWSNKTKKFVGHISSNGYWYLGYKGYRLPIHRVIYRKFNGALDDSLTINHIDGVKTNNSSLNLEQITQDENNLHALTSGLIPKGNTCRKSKLTESDVKKIKGMFSIHTIDSIAATFNVHRNTIKSIKYGRTWTHI